MALARLGTVTRRGREVAAAFWVSGVV